MTASNAKRFIAYAENGPEAFLPEDKRSAHLDSLQILWPSFEEFQNNLKTRYGKSALKAEPHQCIQINNS
jgi:hypothetical protein